LEYIRIFTYVLVLFQSEFCKTAAVYPISQKLLCNFRFLIIMNHLRPSVIEFNIRKRCLSEVQHQLGLQYFDEGQLSKTSQVKDKYEDCDQDEIYNGYYEDNQSIDHFADCEDNSSISCFVTEDAGFTILHECDKLIDKK